METRIRFLIVICIFSLTSFVCMAQLLNDLSKTDVTIILKGDHKQSGQLVNYDPGKSITIVKSNGDTVTYQQSEIYQIKRKRPYIMAFTKEFIETGPQHGYHGEYNFEKISRYRGAMGFSTIQGYQFLPWLRAGVGYIYLRNPDVTKKNSEGFYFQTTDHINILIGDAKFFLTRSLFNPFFDLRLGSSLNNGGDFFYNASIGCRFGLRSSKRLAFNFAMGVDNTYTIDSRVSIVFRAGFEF